MDHVRQLRDSGDSEGCDSVMTMVHSAHGTQSSPTNMREADTPVGNSPGMPGIPSSEGEALADPELEVFLASED